MSLLSLYVTEINVLNKEFGGSRSYSHCYKQTSSGKAPLIHKDVANSLLENILIRKSAIFDQLAQAIIRELTDMASNEPSMNALIGPYENIDTKLVCNNVAQHKIGCKRKNVRHDEKCPKVPQFLKNQAAKGPIVCKDANPYQTYLETAVNSSGVPAVV